ncbi:MAG: tetratricopeptide repeat protein [Alphaproteobacteria bacterium]
MKPIKTFLFVSGGLAAGLVAIHLMRTTPPTTNTVGKIPTTNYGAFLAAQHALYTNNFDRAEEFLDQINTASRDYKSVAEMRVLTDFLNGKIPDDISNLKKQKTIASRIIVDANLVQNGKWVDVYARHKNDTMRLMAPFRIWGGVANNYITKSFKFIDSLGTNPSWQAFLRGQIYAEQGRAEKAATAFDGVKPEFLNINDYLYLMSFYKHHNMDARANSLRTKFTTKPGSMFMIGYNDIPDWSVFSGYKNQLAFNLVQTVAHTQSLAHSDLSLILLRFAENVADKNQIQSDAINYHSGLYMMANMGNYDKYFSTITEASPYYPFVKLRLAELNHNESDVRHAVRAQPLFMPAVNLLVGWETQRGNKNAALRVIDDTLKNPDISTAARAYMYKMRAEVNFIFQDIPASQHDIDAALRLIEKPDPDIFSIQARIWAAQNTNLDRAYAYSLALVQFAPGDMCSWDTLGYVIHAREGVVAALDVMERVGEISNSCSALFEHLGDLYVENGDEKLARDAYSRAIELSDDGLVVKPVLEKKLKKVQ